MLERLATIDNVGGTSGTNQTNPIITTRMAGHHDDISNHSVVSSSPEPRSAHHVRHGDETHYLIQIMI